MRYVTAVVGALMGVGVVVSGAQAGPLTPPAGAPDSTYKTLDEVEARIPLNQDTAPGGLTGVFRIEQPGGSYYLTGPLTVPNGKNGIEIAREGVTIDLNGYSIKGNFGSGHGVVIDNFWDGITIRNGVIRDMDGNGIWGPVATNSVIENVVVLDCEDYAMELGGRMHVRDSQAENCGVGVLAGADSKIERCIVSNTQNGVGIEVGAGSAVVESSAISGASGFGIVTGDACTVSGSTARGNNGDGITVGANSIVRDCISADHTGFTGNGIVLGDSSSAIGCTVNDNVGIGVTTGLDGSVIDCEIHWNDGHGIFLVSRSRAIGNLVTGSGINVGVGFSGITVFAGNTDCVIRDNELINNDFNLSVFGSGCTVVRNIARDGADGLINIGGGNFTGATVANPAAAGPWDNIEN